MTTNYFTGLIIDNAQGATTMFGLSTIIRSAIGSDGCGNLPEDVADLFYTAPFSMVNTKEVRVIIGEIE